MNSIQAENEAERSQGLDPFRMYLYEISKHPVLSKEAEREIAERIRLFKDREAEQKLVVANLRLVVKIALDYYSYHLNVLDLIQEGNVGLLRAVRKYDPGRGTRFIYPRRIAGNLARTLRTRGARQHRLGEEARQNGSRVRRVR